MSTKSTKYEQNDEAIVWFGSDHDNFLYSELFENTQKSFDTNKLSYIGYIRFKDVSSVEDVERRAKLLLKNNKLGKVVEITSVIYRDSRVPIKPTNHAITTHSVSLPR